MPITYIENRFDQFLHRCGTDRVAIGQDILAAAKAILQSHGVFAAIVDYSVKGKHTEWIEFGNAELQVSLVPAIIALRNHAVVLAADVTPLGDNCHEVSIHPVATRPPTGDLHAQALSMIRDAIKHVYGELQQRPEQWWRWDYPRMRKPESQPADV
jgi:lauroyl/myristoyl acyltransferase